MFVRHDSGDVISRHLRMNRKMPARATMSGVGSIPWHKSESEVCWTANPNAQVSKTRCIHKSVLAYSLRSCTVQW